MIGQLIKWNFLAMGPLFLGGALISAHSTQKLLGSGVTVQGTVAGLKPVRSSRDNSVSYAPAFRFPVEGGHPTVVVSRTSSKPAAFKVGEVVKVHYPTGHPEDAVIVSFSQLWLGDVVFGSVGTLFCCISLLILVSNGKRNQRDGLLTGDGSGIVRH